MSRLLTGGLLKPTPGTPLNRRHPLAQGLAALVSCAEGGGARVFDPVASQYWTFGSTVTWTTGPLGSAVQGDGTINGVITLPTSLMLGTVNITLEVWAYLPSASLFGQLLYVGNGANGYGIGVGNATSDNTSPGNHIIGIYENVAWLATGVNYNTGWHHVVLVVDGNGHPAIYRDGILVFTSGSGPALAPTTNCRLLGEPGAGTSRFFAGAIAKASIYARALSAAEIQWLYVAPYAMLCNPRPGPLSLIS